MPPNKFQLGSLIFSDSTEMLRGSLDDPDVHICSGQWWCWQCQHHPSSEEKDWAVKGFPASCIQGPTLTTDMEPSRWVHLFSTLRTHNLSVSGQSVASPVAARVLMPSFKLYAPHVKKKMELFKNSLCKDTCHLSKNVIKTKSNDAGVKICVLGTKTRYENKWGRKYPKRDSKGLVKMFSLNYQWG